jgi:hypothetical protein
MLDFDFTTMSLSGTIDAQPLGTLPINSIDSADDITLFAPYSFGSGTAHDVYYDNISVTSVPEPGSIALLGLGCFWAARRRRK